MERGKWRNFAGGYANETLFIDTGDDDCCLGHGAGGTTADCRAGARGDRRLGQHHLRAQHEADAARPTRHGDRAPRRRTAPPL